VDQHALFLAAVDAMTRSDLDDLCRLMLKAIDDSAWRDAARGAGPGHIHQHYTWDHAAALVVQHALAPT